MSTPNSVFTTNPVHHLLVHDQIMVHKYSNENLFSYFLSFPKSSFPSTLLSPSLPSSFLPSHSLTPTSSLRPLPPPKTPMERFLSFLLCKFPPSKYICLLLRSHPFLGLSRSPPLWGTSRLGKNLQSYYTPKDFSTHL